MEPAKIQVQAIPFEEILRSAYETLKIECIGSLFGERRERKSSLIWVVESAHPVQLAARFPNSATLEDGSIRADWSLLYDNIGGYHLHPTTRKKINGVRVTSPGRVYLSKLDRKNLRDDPELIEMVVALRRVKEKGKLGENPFLISGYVGDGQTYRFDVGGYYYSRRIRRAVMQVPGKVLKIFS